MRVLGIDPGVQGAVVLLEDRVILGCWDTPTIVVPGPVRTSIKDGRRKATIRHSYNKAAMAAILWDVVADRGIDLVVIEKTGPMPRKVARKAAVGAGEAISEDSGRGSNPFTDHALGHGRGLWEGICAAIELKVELVAPVQWKAAMIPKMVFAPDTKPSQRRALVKEAARLRAIDLFPAFADKLARKSDDGRAEGALLAEYGRRIGR